GKPAVGGQELGACSQRVPEKPDGGTIPNTVRVHVHNSGANGATMTTTTAEKFVHARISDMDMVYVGYCDAIQDDGTLIDFKTSNDPAEYIRRESISHQLPLLAWALREMGEPEIKRVSYRIIARPSIRWKDRQSWSEYVDECHDWFAKPAVSRKIVEHDLPVDWARVERAVWWLTLAAEAVAHLRQFPRHALKNERSCLGRGYNCPFLRLCETDYQPELHRRVLAEDFEPKNQKVHPVEFGMPTISYSQAATVADCEQRWQWGYGDGLQRRFDFEEDDEEPLTVGKMFHSLRELTV